MTVSANDAHPYPLYNARYRVIFPLLDADGDLVTGATSPDSELSQDCGTFADATNEATEIATSSGMYYLDLIATELDTKSTAIIVKSATAGMKTTPLVLYPVRLPVIRTGTAQAGASSTITLDSGASAKDDFYNGCYVNITNDTPSNVRGQARRIIDYAGSTKVATIEGTWGTNPSSSSTFEILSTSENTSVIAWAGTPVTDPATVGIPDVNTIKVSNTTQTAWDLGASVLLSSGTGTGQLDFTSGVVKSNLTQILGTTLTETAGQIAAAFKQFFNIASPTSTMNTITTVTTTTTATNLTNAPTSGDLTATMKASVNAEVDTALADYDAPTAAELVSEINSVQSDIAALNNLSAAQVNTEVDTALSDYGALKPTVAGRTLDVTTTGGAGVDWSNVENPTATNNLSGTNIKTDQVVASVTGAVGSVTGNVGGNVVGSTASVTSGVTVTTNNDKTGYSISDTGLSTTLMHKIADRILRRGMANVESSADGEALSFRSLYGAIAGAVNRVRSNGGTLSIYKTDDTTVLGTQTETTDPAAEPVVELDTD